MLVQLYFREKDYILLQRIRKYCKENEVPVTEFFRNLAKEKLDNSN